MSLLKSAATVGGLTMVSRVLGFVRDQLIAFMIGTGPVAEAFVVAQRFPNLFRALFAEGAFNAAFVPQFAGAVEGEGPAAAHRFAIEVFSVLLGVAGVLHHHRDAGDAADHGGDRAGLRRRQGDFDLAVDLTRICLSLSAVHVADGAAVGGAQQPQPLHRGGGGADPAQYGMIGSNLVALALGTGNSAGDRPYPCVGRLRRRASLQFMLLAIACRRAGMPLVPRWPRMTPGVKRVLVLSVPGIMSGGIMQINLLVATMIATGFDRAVAYLYYADRLYQLPLGVIGVAIGVVLLPDLSRKLRAGDEQAAMTSQNRALELSLFLTLPADGCADRHRRCRSSCAVRAWRVQPVRHACGGADASLPSRRGCPPFR